MIVLRFSQTFTCQTSTKLTIPFYWLTNSVFSSAGWTDSSDSQWRATGKLKKVLLAVQHEKPVLICKDVG